MPDTEQCVLGATNQTRIGILEADMEKLNKMIFWLVTTSFATLASLVIGLILTIART